MKKNPVKTPFVTFYSFKGGVGRSMALINTAAILADRGFNVLVLDLDLEAPGLSYLSSSLQNKNENSHREHRNIANGFIDLMLNAKERGENSDLFTLDTSSLVKKYTQRYHLPLKGDGMSRGSLHIMPAGRLDTDYPQRFDSLNLRGLYQEGLGEPLIRAFKIKLSNSEFDYVLVDSRTGFSDEAGICTRDLADYLMILSGLNRQNIEGTSEFLTALRTSKGSDTEFQIILSPVPNGEDRLMEEREQIALRSFQIAWGAKIDLTLQIPYHPQLALTEEPHIFRRRRGYLFEAYSAIERKLLDALGHDSVSISNEVKEALIEGDYSNSLLKLQKLIRLPQGYNSLTHLVYEFSDGILRSNQKSDADLLENKISVMALGQAQQGREVLKFLVENMQLVSGNYILERFIRELEQVDLSLVARMRERLVKTFPANAVELGSYANFLSDKLRHLVEAEVFYRRALDLDPKNLSNILNFAFFLAFQIESNDNESADRLAEADSLYATALAIAPERTMVTRQYAQFLAQRKNNIPAAREIVENGIAVFGEDASLLSKFANILLDCNDLPGAFDYYRRAIKAAPKDPTALGGFADYTERCSSDFSIIDSAYQEALNFDNNNLVNNLRYAQFLAKHTDQYENAERYFKRALTLDKENLRAPTAYAEFLGEQLNNYSEMVKTFNDVLALKPNDVDANHSYAIALSSKWEKPEQAKQYYEKAVKFSIPDANLYCNYAQCLLALGDFDEAEDFLFRAFRLNDNYSDLLSAEIAFSRWLVNAFKFKPRDQWLLILKRLMVKNFKRPAVWSFSKILAIADSRLSAEDAGFARALSNAFLDSGKVSELTCFKEWTSISLQDLNA